MNLNRSGRVHTMSHPNGVGCNEYWCWIPGATLVPGEPESSVWTGLKVDKDQWVSVLTLRCLNSEDLESYASSRGIST